MCTPEAYAVMQVGEAVTKYSSDKSQAKAINANSAKKAESLRNSAIWDDNSQIRDKEVKKQQFANKKLQVANRAKEVEGMAMLKLSEKGVGGNLISRLVGQIKREAGNAFSTLDLNYENTIRGIETNRIATNKKYENEILGLPRAYIPSFAPYALNAGLNISAMYLSKKPPSSGSPQSNWNPDTSWMYTPNNLS